MGAFDNHKFDEIFSRLDKVESAIIELTKPVKPSKPTAAKKAPAKKKKEK